MGEKTTPKMEEIDKFLLKNVKKTKKKTVERNKQHGLRPENGNRSNKENTN